MSVYTKLNQARLKFHGLELKKSGHNKFAGYHYFELGDFLIPALKVFEEVGLCAVISFSKDEAFMCIVNVDQPTEQITIRSPMGSAALKGCHEVQNIGAVETYQRRYLWVAALEIVEHDALDSTTGADEKKPKAATATSGALERLDSEERGWIQEIAVKLKKSYDTEGAEKAAERLIGSGLDADQETALWECFAGREHAEMRRKIKDAKAA